jgi:hypothetical protein
MYEGLLYLHSLLRWVILIFLLAAICKSFADRGGAFTAIHQKLGLVLVICCDVILLIGLYQWFAGSWGLKSIKANGMSVVMKDPLLRFFAVEHITAMIIAIVLVHIGRSYSKKDVPDTVKHKRTVLFFGLALLIILISVPWPFRMVGAGRHWFPWM